MGPIIFLLCYVITTVHIDAQSFLSIEAERTMQEFYNEKVDKGLHEEEGKGLIFMRITKAPKEYINYKETLMKKPKVNNTRPVFRVKTIQQTEEQQTTKQKRILKKVSIESLEDSLQIRVKIKKKPPFPTRPPKIRLRRRKTTRHDLDSMTSDTRHAKKKPSSPVIIRFTEYLLEARAKSKVKTHDENNIKPKKNKVYATHSRHVLHTSITPGKKKYNNEIKQSVTQYSIKPIRKVTNVHKRHIHHTTSTSTTKIHIYGHNQTKQRKHARKYTAPTLNVRNSTRVKHLIKKESFNESIRPVKKVFRKPKVITTTSTDPTNTNEETGESKELKLLGPDLYIEKDIPWDNPQENEKIPHSEIDKRFEKPKVVRELKSSHRHKNDKFKTIDKHTTKTTQAVDMEYQETVIENVFKTTKKEELQEDSTYIDVFKDVEIPKDEEPQKNKEPKNKKELKKNKERHKHTKPQKGEERQQDEEPQKYEELRNDDEEPHKEKKPQKDKEPHKDKEKQKEEEPQKGKDPQKDEERTKGTDFTSEETEADEKNEDNANLRINKHKEQKHKIPEKVPETQEVSFQEEVKTSTTKAKKAWKNQNLSFLTSYQQEKLKNYLEHKRQKKLLRAQNLEKGKKKTYLKKTNHSKTNKKHDWQKKNDIYMRGDDRSNAEPIYTDAPLEIFYRKAHKVVVDPDLIDISFSLDSKGDVKESIGNDDSGVQEQNREATDHHETLEVGLEIPAHHHHQFVLRSRIQNQSSQETQGINRNRGEDKKSDMEIQGEKEDDFLSYKPKRTKLSEEIKSLKSQYADKRKGLFVYGAKARKDNQEESGEEKTKINRATKRKLPRTPVEPKPLLTKATDHVQTTKSFNEDIMDKIVPIDKERIANRVADRISVMDDVYKTNYELNYDLSQDSAPSVLKYKLVSDSD